MNNIGLFNYINMSRIKSTISNYCWLLGLTLSFSSTPVFAAKTDDATWYQVELIIFSYDSEPSPTAELWRDDFNPVYPENTIILRSLNSQQEILDAALESAIKNNKIVSDEAGQNAEGTDAEIDPEIDIEKDPYILLPDNEWQLSNEAKRLERASGIRIMEHIAWRQPVDERKKSHPILIQAGQQYGLSFEVEGLVTVTENRHLHVDTNLFFSKYKLELFDNSLDWSSLNTPATEPEQSIDLTNTSISTVENSVFFENSEPQHQREYTSELKHIRRLRADEIHYIDHPLFGLLVKVSSHKLPDPALEIMELDLSILPALKPLPNEL